MRARSIMVGLVALGTAGGAWAAAWAQVPSAPFNILETRQAGQDLLSGTFAGIIQGVKHNADVKAFANPAAAMARWMKQFPTTFPPGSDKGPTKALPTVWTDEAGFHQAAANFVEAAEKLSQLAKAGDTAGFTSQVTAVGDACKACHDKFRAK